jgi:hypothetical protein
MLDQSVEFTSLAPTDAVVNGSTYTPTASASSGLTAVITVDASASSICSISGGTVSFIGAGTCVLDANQAGDETYNPAPQVQQSFDVGKASQTVAFTSTAPTAARVGGATYTPTAHATSGLAAAITVDASASSVCSISGGTVSFIGAGTCVLDANQAGDDTYNPATQVQQSFVVAPAMLDQSVEFTSLAPTDAVVNGSTYTPTASASSGLTAVITVDASASSICSISGGTVSFIGAGTCVLDANQAGDDTYNPAPQVQQSFVVAPAMLDQSVEFTSLAPTDAVVNGSTYTPTASASSGLTAVITVDASASSICSISGGTVSFIGAGTCVLDANQAGDETYNPAPQVQQSFDVGKASQTVAFTSTAPTAARVGGATYTPTAHATSGLAAAITVDASASSVCSISGGTVSFIGAGTCVLDANQAGNSEWSAATQVQQSFVVAPAMLDQSVEFTSLAPTDAVVNGSTYTPTASASSGLTAVITVDASASSICSISGGTVSFIGAGTCVLDANQAGDDTYNPAPQVQQSFEVGKATLTITWSNPADITYGTALGDIQLDASASVGGTFVYSPLAGTVLGAGTNQLLSVTFTPDDTTDYTSATATVYINVAPAPITVTANPGQTKVFGASDPTLTYTLSSGSLVGDDAFTGALSRVTGETVGLYAITQGSLYAGPNYDLTFVSANFSITAPAMLDQSVEFTSLAPTEAVVNGSTYTPTASASSGLTAVITVDASASSICSISDGTVSFIGAGTCVLDANQAGDDTYNPAPQVQQSFEVGKATLTITWSNPADITYGTALGDIQLDASASVGGTFVYSPLAGTVLGAGTNQLLSVTFTPDDTTDYTSATATVYINVAPAPITVTANPGQTKVFGASDPTLTYTLSSGSLVGDDAFTGALSRVTGETVGLYAITQGSLYAGPNYDLTFVSANFSITAPAMLDQSVEFTSLAPTEAVVNGSTYTPTASASSGLTAVITVDASASSICSISDGTVSFIGAGTCVLDANQAGDDTYNPAPQVQQSFEVGKATLTITWSNPADITYGTALGDIQLDASASVGGTFVYSPLAGTVLGAGTNQLLSVTFTPDDTTDYTSATATVYINVAPAPITVTANPGQTKVFGASDPTLTYTLSSGSLVGDDAFTGALSRVTGETVGLYAITQGSLYAGPNYDLTFVSANFSITAPAMLDQSVEFTSLAPTEAVVNGSTYTPTASASSGLTAVITVDASASSICSISDGTVSFIGAGTCVLDANQAGDDTYNPAPQVQQSFEVGKASQTVAFTSTAPTAATIGGPTYTPTAHATSGLAAVITVDATASSICSISGGIVSFLAAGSCVLDANQAGNETYNPAPQVQQSFDVGKASQTVAFTSTAPTAASIGGPTYTPTAHATSGLAAVITVDATASSICSISGGIVSFLAAGSCVLDANQAGDETYNPAPQVQQSFVVAPAMINQTVAFTSDAPLSARVGGTTYTPTAHATSGLAAVITVDATASSICSISGGIVSFLAAGSCVLDANQAGDDTYNPAPQVQQSFDVGKASQTVAFTSIAPPSARVGGATYTPTAHASSGLAAVITVDASASSICSISGGIVSFLATGTCVLDANQAGNSQYNPATKVQQSFNVAPAMINQTVAFTSDAPLAATVGGPTYTPTARATSGLTTVITVDATASSVCSISAGTVNFIGTGACVLDANQAGDEIYNPAPQVQQSFDVGKADQTVAFTSDAPLSARVGGTTYTPTAHATSGLAAVITVDATASSICSISGGIVSFLAAGSCVLDANQAGNGDWNAATQVQQSFDVAPAMINQTVAFTSDAPLSARVGGTTYTPTAHATSGLAVTIAVDVIASSVCSISAGTVSFLAAGSCVLDANQAGDDTYNPAPQVQQSFVVAPAMINQTVAFTSDAPLSARVGGTTYTPTAHATSGLAAVITVDATASSICSISGGIVSFLAAGSCVLDANQAGNGDWNAATQVQQSFDVAPAMINQTVAFTSDAPLSARVGGTTYTPTAHATSGLAVTIAVDVIASSVCSISAGTVSFLAAGSCVLDANQAGDDTYNPAPQVQQSFVVAPAMINQTVAFTSDAPLSARVGGTTYTPTAHATSGLAAVITVDATASSICSISGGIVSFLAAGSCVLDANQAGDDTYNPAPQVQQSFDVAPAMINQTVAFTSDAPPSARVGGATYTPTAHASSGLAAVITVDASASSICSISGGIVSFLATGTCVLDANQAGDETIQPRDQGPAVVRCRQGQSDGRLHLYRTAIGQGWWRNLHPNSPR